MIAVDAAGGAVDALWIDGRPGRSAAGRLRRGRGGRPRVRAMAGIRGGADGLQRLDRPQAPDPVPAQRRIGSVALAPAAPRIGPAMRWIGPPMKRAFTWADWWPARRGRWPWSRRPCSARFRCRRPRRSSCCRSCGCPTPRRSSRTCWTPAWPRPRATCSTGGRSAWLATPTRSFRDWIDEAAEAILIVEFEGDDSGRGRREDPHGLRTGRPHRACVSSPSRLKRAECERLLGLRRLLEPLLMRFRGPARPVSFIDDVAVPPDGSPLSCSGCRACSSSRTSPGRSTPTPAKAGCGCGRFSTWRPRRPRQAGAAGRRVYNIVSRPAARSRAPGLRPGPHAVPPQQYGELVQVFREIKDAFDPQDQLNPGRSSATIRT